MSDVEQKIKETVAIHRGEYKRGGGMKIMQFSPLVNKENLS